MRNFLSISTILILIAACHQKPGEAKAAPPPRVKKARVAVDSITPEPQSLHIVSGALASQVTRVVSYSYLDLEDYEEDTFSKAPSFQMLPDYSRFGWKYDPHPKVILTKKQIHRLLAILDNPKSYKPVRSTCYSPRNCFCFYNNKKEIIGYYQVCFESNRLIAVPGFKGSESGTFSDNGAKRLRSFCRSVGITVR